MSEIERLQERLREFADARDWHQFHTPKNLAMALVAEAGEVVEHFQWLAPDASAALAPATRDEVALELADVLLYLVMLADKLGVDLAAAAHRKIDLNATRYPADSVRGKSDKRRGD